MYTRIHTYTTTLLLLLLPRHYYLTEYLEGPHLVRARSETKRQLPHVQLFPRILRVIHEKRPYVCVCVCM